jgi:hypothetical protein
MVTEDYSSMMYVAEEKPELVDEDKCESTQSHGCDNRVRYWN